MSDTQKEREDRALATWHCGAPSPELEAWAKQHARALSDSVDDAADERLALRVGNSDRAGRSGRKLPSRPREDDKV